MKRIAIILALALASCAGLPPEVRTVLDKVSEYSKEGPPATQRAYRLALDMCLIGVDIEHPTREQLSAATKCTDATRTAWKSVWKSMAYIDQGCEALPGLCVEPTDLEDLQ